MEDWTSKCELRLQEMWTLANEGYAPAENTFPQKLAEMLQELINEGRSKEDIVAWFKAIPPEYWEYMKENVFHVAALIDNDKVVRYLISEGHTDFNGKNYLSHTPLSMAVEAGNSKVVKALLDVGAIHDNTYYQKKIGPLHTAAGKGFSNIIKMLIDAGAEVDACDYEDCSPLYWLFHFQVKTTVNPQVAESAKLLLEAGADMNIGINEDLLICAINHRNYDVAIALIEAGADTKVVDTWSSRTPLHLAAQRKGAENLLKRLIDIGDDPNAVDSNGRTALCLSIISDNRAAAEILVNAGVSTKFSEIPRFSPMHDAVENNSAEMVDFLSTLKTDINMMEMKKSTEWPIYHGLTCLQYAAYLGLGDMVIKLLELGANINARCASNYTVLQYAVITDQDQGDTNRNQLLKTLLLKGVGGTFNPDEDHSMFYSILKFADEETIRLFLSECRFDISKYYPVIGTLVYAMSMNHKHGYKLLKFILKNQTFDIHAKDEEGWGPLHHAGSIGNAKIIKFFLKNGANVNDVNNAGETPLQLACRNGKLEIIKLLLNFNADVNKGRELPLKEVMRIHSSRWHRQQVDVENMEQIIVKYIAVEEASGEPSMEGNHRVLRRFGNLQKLHENCTASLKLMKEYIIYDSITFFDVFRDPQQYYHNRYVIEAIENQDIINIFGEYSSLLTERFERFRKRPKLIQQAERVLRLILVEDSRLLSALYPRICEYLTNKDLRNLILV